jgi:hypothetical protein
MLKVGLDCNQIGLKVERLRPASKLDHTAQVATQKACRHIWLRISHIKTNKTPFYHFFFLLLEDFQMNNNSILE